MREIMKEDTTLTDAEWTEIKECFLLNALRLNRGVEKGMEEFKSFFMLKQCAFAETYRSLLDKKIDMELQAYKSKGGK